MSGESYVCGGEFRKWWVSKRAKLREQKWQFGKWLYFYSRDLHFGVCSFSVSKTPGILSDSFNG